MGERRRSLIVAAVVMVMMLGALVPLALSGESCCIDTLVIMDNTKLRSFAIVGSFLGAILSVSLLMPSSPTLRSILIQLAGASISGIAFTPLLLRYMQFVPDSDTMLGGAALVAMVSTITLHRLIPFYEKWLDKKLNDADKE